MSTDTFTEVTNQSWFSRLGNAFKGIVVGLVLLVVAFSLLFWNEGRAVKRYKSLKEGSAVLVSIPADKVDPANQGKLVHLSGMALTEETLVDPLFGVTSQAIQLVRSVEMYQWEQNSQSQEKKKLGGGTETTTTYTYTQTWSDNHISSSNFKSPQGHENPAQMHYQPEKLVAQTVTVGAFTLSPSLIGKINDFSRVELGGDYKLPNNIAAKGQVTSNTIYLGNDPGIPRIGDVRVTFQEIRPHIVSLVSRQIKNTFEPYQAKAGGSVELLVSGEQSGKSMFQQAQKSNTVLTWVLRATGCILLFLGFKLILGPFSVFSDVVPIFGSIVAAGTGLISALIAVFLSCITVAIAWIVYRPVVGISLIVIAAGIGFFVFSRLRQAATAGTGPSPSSRGDG